MLWGEGERPVAVPGLCQDTRDAPHVLTFTSPSKGGWQGDSHAGFVLCVAQGLCPHSPPVSWAGSGGGRGDQEGTKRGARASWGDLGSRWCPVAVRPGSQTTPGAGARRPEQEPGRVCPDLLPRRPR